MKHEEPIGEMACVLRRKFFLLLMAEAAERSSRE